jgi:hypothetical protein
MRSAAKHLICIEIATKNEFRFSAFESTTVTETERALYICTHIHTYSSYLFWKETICGLLPTSFLLIGNRVCDLYI